MSIGAVALLTLKTLLAGGALGASVALGAEASPVTQPMQLIVTQQPNDVDYESLDCGQLLFLARKYSSIADGALRMGGDSPAATATQMQGMQAANMAARLYTIMAQKGCQAS